MSIDPQEFAQLLGAKIAGEVSDASGGPFGMAQLAHILHGCLTPSQGERPGRPTNPNWTTRCKVPMSEETLRELAQMAKQMCTPDRKISPMQVAAQLLEEAIASMRVKTISSQDTTVPAPDGVKVGAAGTENGLIQKDR